MSDQDKRSRTARDWQHLLVTYLLYFGLIVISSYLSANEGFSGSELRILICVSAVGAGLLLGASLAVRHAQELQEARAEGRVEFPEYLIKLYDSWRLNPSKWRWARFEDALEKTLPDLPGGEAGVHLLEVKFPQAVNEPEFQGILDFVRRH